MWLVRLFTATTSWYDDCINLLQTHCASFALVRWHRHLFFFCFVFCTLATAESMLDMRVGSLCTLAWVELYRHLLFFPFSPFAWFYIFFPRHTSSLSIYLWDMEIWFKYEWLMVPPSIFGYKNRVRFFFTSISFVSCTLAVCYSADPHSHKVL